jgi:hypothetical protein
VNETSARVVFLFRNRKAQLAVSARHRAARLEALRLGLPEIVDPRTGPHAAPNSR